MLFYFKTVKTGVITLMLIFAIIVTSLVFIFSFYLIYVFQKNITIKSTEFNLQLVSNIIEQDIVQLSALSKWCSNNEDVIKYIDSDENNIHTDGVHAYYKVNNEFINSKVMSYASRMIIVDSDYKKFLQVGSAVSGSEPLTIYNVNKMKDYNLNSDSKWQTMIDDNLYLANAPSVLPLTTPIYSTKNNSEVGVIYLFASTNVITDKLKGYSLENGSKLYLTLKNGSFQIIDNKFVETNNYFTSSKFDTNNTLQKTTVAYGKDNNGKNVISVSYPIGDNIKLSQIIPIKQMMIIQGNWLLLLLLICILIIFLSMIATYNLDKNISKPVAKLKRRIDLISNGDFSFDESIESNNELGQVGKGINNLSHKVTVLMNNKIEDEKNKRLLEYRMLQNQINPHFLYNTLNSIKIMAIIQSAEGIAEMSTALSKLLRTVSKDMRTLVPLKDELELLNSYIIIQKYRYSDSVKVEKNIKDEKLLEALIPRFSLQPIVENAIFHGIEPKGSGVIYIEVKLDNNIVHCSICDDGVGISREAMKKILTDNSNKNGMLGSIGIRNVDERLKHAFGEDFSLIIQSEKNKFTKMTIRLPFESKSGEETYD